MRRVPAVGGVLVVLAVLTACSDDDRGTGPPVPTPTVASASATGSAVVLSALEGSTTPLRFTLAVDVPGATAATLIVDGQHVGEDEAAPLTFGVEVTPGEHRLRVRLEGTDADRRDVSFTADGAIDAAAGTSAPTTASPTIPAQAAPGERLVDSVEAIRAALADARPGDVVVVADGEYQFKPRLVASASGTAAEPITLRGSRRAVLRTKNASGDYGLHVTGDHWRVEGLTVAHATKGIVLDGSVGTVIDGVEVFDIGDEAVHFRSCSSDGVLRNAHIHDTGRNSPQYGEGVYVGSASSNWSTYECTDDQEDEPRGDNTERVLIEDNLFEDVTAEGADLKEGTDSGTLRRNTFRRTGTSGMNSADSAVDAKGNGWLIEDNVVTDTGAPWDDDGTARPSEFADGYQSHQVADGYGTGNTFRRNHVEGSVPGYGIGLYPALGNVVTCDNTAPGAASGLVGDNGRRGSCHG